MKEETVALLIPVTYFALMLLERIIPARPLPKVKRWYLKGIVFFVIVMVASGVAPVIAASLVGDVSPLGLSSLGTVAGAIVTILVSALLQYGMHRYFHTNNILWRFIHQLHHSAERLDVPGAAFTHPMEVVIGGTFGTIATMLLGVSPEAAGIAGFFGVFNAIFQHANIKTPRWLGYVIQRPESHSVHHARGVHAYNYSDVPLFDMLFGTFRNPRSFMATQGFWDGASAQIGCMLIGHDVSEAVRETETVPVAPPSSGTAVAG